MDEAEQLIDHLRDRGLGVSPVCRVLELSPSTYFARKKRPKSARRLRDEQLMPLIGQVHTDPGGTCGARRITRALRRKGHEVARCTVERLVAEPGPGGRPPRPTPPHDRPGAVCAASAGPGRPRLHRHPARPALGSRQDLRPHLVGLGIRGTRPGQRMIVGWQVANHIRTELPLKPSGWPCEDGRARKTSVSFITATAGRRADLIRYTDRLSGIGASASVGPVADSYDNAMDEDLNGTFKAELIETQGPLEGRRPGRAGDPPVDHVVQRRNACTPRSTTCRRRSTSKPSGGARSKPRSPPAPSRSRTTKRGAVHRHRHRHPCLAPKG
ncbi:IS3 family transposase [Streptomyces sp. TRM70308]|uniref:IS3 family transposase n=1 Tax=Streptomyces sp. TRM70308 TaxID=3131932 RepID=UPI003D0864B5